MPKTKTVDLTVTIKAPNRMSRKRIAKLIEMCIAIGMNDASESADDRNLDHTDDANDCCTLTLERIV